MFGTLFGFNGRLSRAGFFEALISIVLIDVGLVLGQKYVEAYGLPGAGGSLSPLASTVVAAAPWVIVLFTLWSLLAVSVKRCHDRGRPGILLLLALIPVFGWLWLFVDLWLLAGNKGKNRYGRAPHSHEESGPVLWGGAEPAVAVPVSADAAAVAAHDAHDAHAPASHQGEGHQDHGEEGHAHEQAPADPHQDTPHGEAGHEAPQLEPALAAVEHAPEAQPQEGQEREVPAFVQRFATIYYDPTPPKPARDDEHAAAHAHAGLGEPLFVAAEH